MKENQITMETVNASITILSAFAKKLNSFLEITAQPVPVVQPTPAAKTVPARRRARRHFSQAVIDAAVDAYAQGDSMLKITRRYNVTAASVYRWLRERNVSRGQALEAAAKSTPETH